MNIYKDILIISGGRVDTGHAATCLKRKKYDRIIAADSGLSACNRLGVDPTDILGDFDSLKDRSLLDIYRQRGAAIRTYPERKDYSDTHLAIGLAADLGASRITILGATGTRYDHSLANIGLLSWLADRGIEGLILDEYNEMSMLKGPVCRRYRKDRSLPFFSLLAWGGPAEGISLTGFSYPLEKGILTCDISRGISNQLIEDIGTVSLDKGYLLVIRSRD